MFGRLQRYVNEVKADINREMELDELRKLQTQVQDAARDIEHSVTSAAQEVESGMRSVESELNAQGQEPAGGSEAVADGAPNAAEPTPTSSADAVKSDPPKQAVLPGFERI
jgi:sec-independent protein translocase protein TatB